MSLKLYYRPSFNRTLKHLGYEQRKIVGSILEAVGVYYSSGCSLLETQKVAPRFFYKQLDKLYYEAGVERNMRVVNCHFSAAGFYVREKIILINK